MRASALVLIAAGIVLASATDWELRVSGEASPICATGRETCEMARAAIRKGWLPPIPRDATTECAPHAWCRSPASECIGGYNCLIHVEQE